MEQNIEHQEKDKCWICGDMADSGEHIIKKSDLKLLFPNTSQQSRPIYIRKNGEFNRAKTIGALKSKLFHFKAKICQQCNNHRSYDFDVTWDKLSKYLYKNWSSILENGYINLEDIFETDINNTMILVQLFFVKIFGCKWKEADIEFDISPLSKAILDREEQSNFYISFRNSENNYSADYCASSDIEILTNKKTGELIYMHQFYSVGKITVDMIYVADKNIIDLNGALKPSEMSNILQLSKLNYNQNYIKG